MQQIRTPGSQPGGPKPIGPACPLSRPERLSHLVVCGVPPGRITVSGSPECATACRPASGACGAQAALLPASIVFTLANAVELACCGWGLLARP